MTIGNLYNTANVVVGQAALFTALPNMPLPGFNLWNAADPFDTTSFWTPGSGFTGVGGTEQGWSTNFNKATQNINIEEQSIPVAQTIQSQELQFNGALAEDSSLSLAIALNALKSTSAPTATASVGTLGTALTSGTAPTQITLSASNTVAIPPNSPIVVAQGTNTQTFISANTSTILVTSATVIPLAANGPQANFSYPITTTTVSLGALPGFDQLTLQDVPVQFAVALATVNEKGFGRLYYVPLATQVAASATAFRRAAALRAHPVTFQSLCKPAQIGVYNFTAAHL